MAHETSTSLADSREREREARERGNLLRTLLSLFKHISKAHSMETTPRASLEPSVEEEEDLSALVPLFQRGTTLFHVHCIFRSDPEKSHE